MAPRILASWDIMVGIYRYALKLVEEKEESTVEQINVTPLKKHHFILGKLIPFLDDWCFVYSLISLKTHLRKRKKF